MRALRWIGTLAAMLALAGVPGGAAPPVDIQTAVSERSTPDFTLRFAGPRRCVAGASAGHVCETSSDCPSSTCAVTAAAPSQVVVQIDAYTVAPTVSLLAPMTLAGASTVTFTPPSSAHRIVQSRCYGGTAAKATCAEDADCPGGTCDATVPSEDHMLSLQWSDTCVGGTRTGSSCASDTDCRVPSPTPEPTPGPTPFCRTFRDQRTFTVVNKKFKH